MKDLQKHTVNKVKTLLFGALACNRLSPIIKTDAGRSGLLNKFVLKESSDVNNQLTTRHLQYPAGMLK
jgi:hypothetical protein